jgi:hypothetical protein
MAMGKPIVSTKLYGVLLEFGEGNGLNYCDTPQQCLTTILDILKRRIILSEGTKAKKFVQNNSWGKITDMFEQEIGQIK